MVKSVLTFLFAGFLFAGSMLAHGGNEHIMGTVSAINGDHVTIRTQDGKSEMVMLSKTTKYFTGSKASRQADMKVGSRVVVDAKMDPKMKMYSALEVKIGVVDSGKTDSKAKPAAPADKHSEHK
jgi:hypothetical protein